MSPKYSTLIGNEETHLHIAAIIFFCSNFFHKLLRALIIVWKCISLWALIHVIILFYLSHILLWAVIIFSVYVQIYMRLMTTDLDIVAPILLQTIKFVPPMIRRYSKILKTSNCGLASGHTDCASYVSNRSNVQMWILNTEILHTDW